MSSVFLPGRDPRQSFPAKGHALLLRRDGVFPFVHTSNRGCLGQPPAASDRRATERPITRRSSPTCRTAVLLLRTPSVPMPPCPHADGAAVLTEFPAPLQRPPVPPALPRRTKLYGVTFPCKRPHRWSQQTARQACAANDSTCFVAGVDREMSSVDRDIVLRGTL